MDGGPGDTLSCDVLKANRVVLVDESGVMRAKLEAGPAGTEIRFLDREGNERIVLGVTNDVPVDRARIMILDPGMELRAVLGGHKFSVGDGDVIVQRPSGSLVLVAEDEGDVWRAPMDPWLE
jgi:hypothetical protein